jgi:hypothetical protein
MISRTKSYSPGRITKPNVTRRTKSHSPTRSRSRGSRLTKKRGVASNPIGLTPRLKLVNVTDIVPENELTTGEEYLIEHEWRTTSGKHHRRKYKGVLDKLKDENSCYNFKYLENIKKNDNIYIPKMVWYGDDNEVFVKVYANTNNETILTVEELKRMDEVGEVVIGETYYVRFVDSDENDRELINHGAFRGTYRGEQYDDEEYEDDHVFSNIMKLNKKLCGNVTFHYTAEAAKQKNRQTRVFSKLIPGFYTETRYGGNKCKNA